MNNPHPADRTPSHLAAFVGRFFGVLAATILGATLGLIAGAFRANAQMNAAPQHPEFEELSILLVWAINLALGGAAGLVLGLLGGVVAMVFYRRRRG